METVAIIGATGAVGREILSILETRQFPLQQLRCFASAKSKGQTLSFRQKTIPIEVLEENALQNIDLAFFCAGSSISKEWIPKTKSLVVDSSSAFRSSIPLIIPEINTHVLKKEDRVIASPNCAATILLLPLAPLHRRFRAKRIVLSTYQAASGAGAYWVRELENETKAFIEKTSYTNSLPYPYAFNLFPHQSALDPSGYVEEELKILHETRKILEDPSLQLSASCVRVPVLRAHAISANIEFHNPFSLEEVSSLLSKSPGITFPPPTTENKFPTPLDATGKDLILCGRLRKDPSQANTLELWAVGDQLRKGAALNAVQIAESLYLLHNKTVTY